jgi:hypothetical protein
LKKCRFGFAHPSRTKSKSVTSMNKQTNSDSYDFPIIKTGMIFTGTRKDLLKTIDEMKQLGLWKSQANEVSS